MSRHGEVITWRPTVGRQRVCQEGISAGKEIDGYARRPTRAGVTGVVRARAKVGREAAARKTKHPTPEDARRWGKLLNSLGTCEAERY